MCTAIEVDSQREGHLWTASFFRQLGTLAAWRNNVPRRGVDLFPFGIFATGSTISGLFMYICNSKIRLILTLTNLFYSILQISYSFMYFLVCILFYLAHQFPIPSYSVFYYILFSVLSYLARYSILFYFVIYSVNSILQNPQFSTKCLTHIS